MKKNYGIWLLILVFVCLNLLFLTDFPFVHSDEVWLSGHTRAMMESGSFGVTEPFFNLFPRFPHAVKITFHALQMLFFAALPYGVFASRLPSLLFGAMCLYLFYKLARDLLGDRKIALISSAVLAVDIQFIYASHLARQEIILLWVMLLVLLLLIKGKKIWLAAMCTGLAAGLHPNAFLIAAMAGCVIVYQISFLRSRSFWELLQYIFITGGVAGIFVAISFYFDPMFITNYMAYGNREFELFAPTYSRTKELIIYFQKLFWGVSGTYYTPNIKIQLLLFGVAAALTPMLAWRRREARVMLPWCAALGLVLGTVAIGRYNQTGAVFLFPFMLLCVVFCLKALLKRGNFATMVLACVLAASSVANIYPWLNGGYNEYLEQIAAYVPKDSRALCNLNAGYYFENGSLTDVRNLTYMRDNDMTFAEYIESEGIRYIVYSSELEMLYNVRPKWNFIYGNLYFFEDMREYLQNECEALGSFTDNRYGGRIVAYMDEKEFVITVYKVK